MDNEYSIIYCYTYKSILFTRLQIIHIICNRYYFYGLLLWFYGFLFSVLQLTFMPFLFDFHWNRNFQMTFTFFWI